MTEPPVSSMTAASALTLYADEQLQERIARSQATHTSFTPNRRFIKNRFAEQLFSNSRLRRELEQRNLSWEAGMPAVKSVYLSLVATPWYKEYMEQAECTYEDDKRLWRQIYQYLLYLFVHLFLSLLGVLAESFDDKRVNVVVVLVLARRVLWLSV